MNETKARILDTAERLIADHGFDISLRAITAEAGVNLAAVNYHFQSKGALFNAVIDRRIGPVNEVRFRLLDEIEREHPEGPLVLEDVLRAFIAPVLEVPGVESIRVLIGRLYAYPEEFLTRMFNPHLRVVAVRFRAALARALPELPEPEQLWCLMFTIGSMVHTLAWSRIYSAISDGLIDGADPAETSDRIVQFAAAGFRDACARHAESPEGARHA